MGIVVVSLSRREVLVEAFGSEFVIKRIDDITADIEEKEKWVIISAVEGLSGQIILLGVQAKDGPPLEDTVHQVLLRIGAEKQALKASQIHNLEG